ncbi:hypothetical protein [Ensifer adhaerens]|uniref:hypothetical protein n=1 Tax=Ensifer adhaerens TaxID=106592 RepID=UPI00131A0B8E|nr:hypothetical protein [Ensifer adhaerens]
MEVCDGLARLDEGRDAAFGGGDDHNFGLREVVAAYRHQPRDGAGRGYARQRVGIRLLGSAPAGRHSPTTRRDPRKA